MTKKHLPFFPISLTAVVKNKTIDISLMTVVSLDFDYTTLPLNSHEFLWIQNVNNIPRLELMYIFAEISGARS